MPSEVPSSAAETGVSDWVQGRKIRLALFLPQYAEDPISHEIEGIGTGFLGIELIRSFAASLDIEAQTVGYPTPADVVECLKTGAGDVAFMGIEPSRAAQLDFSPAVFQFEYTFLVPPGSTIQNAADADQPGVRIAFVQHHAAALTLCRVAKHAELMPHELPENAFDTLRSGNADAFAFPRPVLADFSIQLPGSRVLPGAYGVNRVGIAIRKGQSRRLALIRDFVEAAKASGLVQRAIAKGNLLEYQVAPPE